MKVSIIIPMYNAEKTISSCLDSVKSSNYEDLEVIIVDDNSSDSSLELAKKYSFKIVSLEGNKGPAFARNTGADHAVGDILFFLDSDGVIANDTITKVVDTFIQHPDTQGVVGLYALEPLNNGIFPLYDSLRKYYEWKYFPSGEYSSFSTNGGAIKRETFMDLKGFRSAYKKADVEDFEFGYRLTEKNKVYYNNDIEISHYAPTFKEYKKFFKRIVYWVRLFLKRKKFDNIKTTRSEASNFLIGFGIIIFFIIGIFIPYVLIISLILLIYHFIVDFRFYRFVSSCKGHKMAFYSFFITLYLSSIIGLATSFSILTYPFYKEEA